MGLLTHAVWEEIYITIPWIYYCQTCLFHFAHYCRWLHLCYCNLIPLESTRALLIWCNCGCSYWFLQNSTSPRFHGAVADKSSNYIPLVLRVWCDGTMVKLWFPVVKHRRCRTLPRGFSPPRSIAQLVGEHAAYLFGIIVGSTYIRCRQLSQPNLPLAFLRRRLIGLQEESERGEKEGEKANRKKRWTQGEFHLLCLHLISFNSAVDLWLWLKCLSGTRGAMAPPESRRLVMCHRMPMRHNTLMSGGN